MSLFSLSECIFVCFLGQLIYFGIFPVVYVWHKFRASLLGRRRYYLRRNVACGYPRGICTVYYYSGNFQAVGDHHVHI